MKKMRPYWLRLAFLAVAISALLLTSLTSMAGAPDDDDDQPYRLESTRLWFVELSGAPLTESSASPGQQKKQLDAEKAAFRTAAAAAGISFKERYAFDTLWNGVSIEIDPSRVSLLARLPGVVAVYPVAEIAAPQPPSVFDGPPENLPELATAINLTGAALAHASGYTGAGVNIAIMDTGVDYNHPDLGGPGFPNSRVLGGWDFVGDNFPNVAPQPDADPMDCNGHGSHVTGIAAAGGTIKGAAPAANIRMYKVFGCTGGTSADIMIAAMEMALADGNHVLNMSIGSAFQWPQYPTARASNNMVNKGMVVVASAGNSGANGLYSMSAPATGRKVIGVASLLNTHANAAAFQLGAGPLVGFNQMTNTVPFPLSGSGAIADGGPDRGCNGPVPGVAGMIALLQRGGATAGTNPPSCSFRTKVLNAQAGGAVALIVYNNVAGAFLATAGTPPLTGPGDIPAVTISQADGNLILGQLPISLTWGFFLSTPVATGGVIAASSSYGLSPDLDFKPDITAPGGNILSTVIGGRYGLNSGTSMAAPHVAGAAALLLEARPNTPSQIVRDILQNNAVPFNRVAAPAGVEATYRQGAGLLNIDAAISSTTKLTPAKIALGETEGSPVSRTIHLENNGSSAVTYDITHLPANANQPGTFAPIAANAPATASFPASVTVAAGGSASINVTITEPAGISNGGLFGGFIVFTPQGGGQTHRVPYAGFKGDYQSILYLNPAAFPAGFGNPVLRPSSAFGASTPVTLNYADADPNNDFAFILFHTDHQPRRIRVEILDAGSGRSFGRIFQNEYFGRNSAATSFFALSVPAVDRKGFLVPAGTYVLRFTLQKALGEDDNPADWESWTSPVITVIR